MMADSDDLKRSIQDLNNVIKSLKENLSDLGVKTKKTKETFDTINGLSIDKFTENLDKRQKKASKQIDDMVKTMSKSASGLVDLASPIKKAVDSAELSNRQLTKSFKSYHESLIKSIEENTEMSDSMKAYRIEQLKNIKTVSQATEFIEHLGDSVKEVDRMLTSGLGSSVKEFEKNLNSIIKDDKQRAEILKDFRYQVNELGISVKNYTHVDITKALQDQRTAVIMYAKVTRDWAEELERSKGTIQSFGKYVDESTSKLKRQIVEFATWGSAVAILSKALRKGAQEFVKLNSIGLAGTFSDLEKAATRYGVKMETLMKISDENRVTMYRDAIQNGKSFAQAQQDFLDRTDKLANESGLSAQFGKDRGQDLAAQSLQTVSQAGVSLTQKDSAGNVIENKKAVKTAQDMVDNQLLLSRVIGLMPEQYLSEIKSLRDLEEMQAVLINSTEDQRTAIMASNVEMYKQLKLLGLNNAQIEANTRAAQDAKNPLKTAFKEALMRDVIGPRIVAMMSRGGKNSMTSEQLNRLQDLAKKTDRNVDENIELTNLQTQYGKMQAEFKNIDVRKNASKYALTSALGNMPGVSAFQQAYAVNAETMAANQVQNKSVQGSPEQIAANALDAGLSPKLQAAQNAIERLTNMLESVVGQLVLGGIAAAAALTASGANTMALWANTKALMGGKLPGGGIDGGGADKGKGGKGGKVPGKVGGGRMAGIAGGAMAIAGTAIGGYAAWNKVNDAQKEKDEGKISEKEFNAEGGKAVGGLAGAGAGAALGMGIGQVLLPIPVVGAAVGGVVGGIAGYFGGSAAGESLGGMFGSDNKEKVEPLAVPRMNGQTTVPQTQQATPVTNKQNNIQSQATPSANGIDPRAKAMLDFTSKFESGGSYTKAVGGSEIKGLEDMTLNEVLQLQNSMIRNKGKYPSSALGKYQVIKSTMMEAIQALNLDPNTTKFNAATQDKIGEYLLNKRGFKKYLNGEISREQLANNMSKEWAALPKDASNKGYYDGDGLNKSGVKWNTMMSQIDSLNTIAPTTSPTTSKAAIATAVPVTSKVLASESKPQVSKLAATADSDYANKMAMMATGGDYSEQYQAIKAPAPPTTVATFVKKDNTAVNTASIAPAPPQTVEINKTADALIADNIKEGNALLSEINKGIKQLLTSGVLRANSLARTPQNSSSSLKTG